MAKHRSASASSGYTSPKHRTGEKEEGSNYTVGTQDGNRSEFIYRGRSKVRAWIKFKLACRRDFSRVILLQDGDIIRECRRGREVIPGL
jgi:hypothetical protein